MRDPNKLLKLAATAGEVLEGDQRDVAGNGMQAIDERMTVPVPPAAT